MPPFVRALRTAARTALLASAIPVLACSKHDPVSLPPEFALRSDTPYVMGRIVERIEATGGMRIHVRDDGDSQLRVTEAIVSVAPDALLRWENGGPASPSDLRVGRRVIVWASGAELRSRPPQVGSNAILLRR